MVLVKTIVPYVYIVDIKDMFHVTGKFVLFSIKLNNFTRGRVSTEEPYLGGTR